MSTDASINSNNSNNSNQEGYGLFTKRIAFLIALLTMCTSMIAYLQSDASARDAEADRDIKYLAVEALGRETSDKIRINYDQKVAYQQWVELDTLSFTAFDQGDEVLAKRYETLRDKMTDFSPLLAPPYFDFPETLGPDIARYEAETHLVEVTVLREELAAASGVKDGWADKGGTYIIHLTLLAISFFLFGLSITIAGDVTRWIFSGLGGLIALFVIAWAVNVWSQPVFDLREQEGVIDAFARGVGLAHQELWEESISAYDEALQQVPDYSNALVKRALAYSNLGENQAAVTDYEEARALGNEDPIVARQLAWNYYLLGSFDEAIDVSRTALEARSDDLQIQFRLALNLLVAGQVDAALAEYQNSMASASTQVASARAAEQEPTSNLWIALDKAVLELNDLLYILDVGESIAYFTPEPDQIADPDAVQRMAPELMQQLKVLSVALEYTSQPPVGELTAELAPFKFGRPTSSEQEQITEYEVSDTFPAETPRVIVAFEYEGMQDGDLVVSKLYQNGLEYVSGRQVFKWEKGPNGSTEIPLTLAIGEDIAESGEYRLELYVNTHLAQSGSFVIQEEE